MKLIYHGRITTSGFVFIEKDVSFIIDKGARVHLNDRVYLKKGCILECRGSGRMILHSGTSIGHYSWIGCTEFVEIGPKALIGHCCTLFDVYHLKVKDRPMADQGYEKGALVLGSDVIITAKCTVGANLSIADGVIVASNSVVTRSISEPHVIYGGSPARKIKERD
jgi:acetyltransferase-like isoleucine patch superfamily enzyme